MLCSTNNSHSDTNTHEFRRCNGVSFVQRAAFQRSIPMHADTARCHYISPNRADRQAPSLPYTRGERIPLRSGDDVGAVGRRLRHVGRSGGAS